MQQSGMNAYQKDTQVDAAHRAVVSAHRANEQAAATAKRQGIEEARQRVVQVVNRMKRFILEHERKSNTRELFARRLFNGLVGELNLQQVVLM